MLANMTVAAVAGRMMIDVTAYMWSCQPLDRDRPLSLLAGYRGLAGDRGLNFLCSTAQATADLQAMEEEVDRGSSGPPDWCDL